LDNIYYFTKTEVINYCDFFESNLYKTDQTGKARLLITGIDKMLLHEKGIYLIDSPYERNSETSIVYYYDFETQGMKKVMEIKNLKSFQISNEYILYSVGSYTNVYLYDIVHKTNIFLNKKLGIEFPINDTGIRNGHIYVYQQVGGDEIYKILDVNIADFTITDADKTNLPEYIEMCCDLDCVVQFFY